MAHRIDDIFPDPDAPRVRLAEAVREVSRLIVTKDIDDGVAERARTKIEAVLRELDKEPDRPPTVGLDLEVLKESAGLFNPVIGWASPVASPMRVAFADDGTVTMTGMLDRRSEGPPSNAHGGAVATLLDQALGHANSAIGIGAFTAELTVRFLKPTPFDVPLVVTAKSEPPDGRTVISRGTLRAGETTTATAEGRFVAWGSV
jgi:acyl-coenzyme A thioesterase PaaI-like protein